MTDTVARLRVGSKHFEIIINLDAALKIRKGKGGSIAEALSVNEVFYNSKEGSKASQDDLKKAFGITDIHLIAEKIIKKGEIELPEKYRDEEKEKKKKQLIEWFIKNSVDAKTNRPFAQDIISSSLDRIGINIDKRPIEQQISAVSEELRKILPIKIETKKIIITIPAIYTGKAYGIINEYKEKEDWLSNGDLKCTINVPVGLQSEFYDKLNSVTHGSALSEELKQPEVEKK